MLPYTRETSDQREVLVAQPLYPRLVDRAHRAAARVPTRCETTEVVRAAQRGGGAIDGAEIEGRWEEPAVRAPSITLHRIAPVNEEVGVCLGRSDRVGRQGSVVYAKYMEVRREGRVDRLGQLCELLRSLFARGGRAACVQGDRHDLRTRQG